VAVFLTLLCSLVSHKARQGESHRTLSAPTTAVKHQNPSMKKVIHKRICEYTECKQLGASRGAKKQRQRWCNFHQKGKGKVERLEFVK